MGDKGRNPGALKGGGKSTGDRKRGSEKQHSQGGTSFLEQIKLASMELEKARSSTNT